MRGQRVLPPSLFADPQWIPGPAVEPTWPRESGRYTEGSTSPQRRMEWRCVGYRQICPKDGRAAATLQHIRRLVVGEERLSVESYLCQEISYAEKDRIPRNSIKPNHHRHHRHTLILGVSAAPHSIYQFHLTRYQAVHSSFPANTHLITPHPLLS